MRFILETGSYRFRLVVLRIRSRACTVFSCVRIPTTARQSGSEVRLVSSTFITFILICLFNILNNSCFYSFCKAGKSTVFTDEIKEIESPLVVWEPGKAFKFVLLCIVKGLVRMFFFTNIDKILKKKTPQKWKLLCLYTWHVKCENIEKSFLGWNLFIYWTKMTKMIVGGEGYFQKKLSPAKSSLILFCPITFLL